MGLVLPASVLAHWNKAVEVRLVPSAFYRETTSNLRQHHLQGMTIEQVTLAQGGLLSPGREYLQVRYEKFVYHICAARLGASASFVSSWMGETESGFITWLTTLPYIGRVVALLVSFYIRLFDPATYYKVDAAQTLHTLVHAAVTKALDSNLRAKGLRPLSDDERKPVMRGILASMNRP